MKKTVLFTTALIGYLLLTSSIIDSKKTETLAIYLKSIVRFIEWPSDMRSGNLRIGVYGSFDTYKTIAQETMGTGLQNRNVDVINISRIDQLKIFDLHILIISEINCTNEQIKKLASLTKSKPTLIVTSKEGSLAYGSAINFISVDEHLRFELNKKNATKNGILIDRQLETFATHVIQ